MNVHEPAQPDLDPELENLMSELDDALFDGRPTDDFERRIVERFGDDSSQIVSTLKALHSAREISQSLSSSASSSGKSGTEALEQTGGTSGSTTWVRATSGLARTVFGRFEIMERVGSGGAGTVFRARDSRLGRLVALKVARAEALFSSEAKQRFVREAQTLAALRHPNIIPIYEFGESGGLPYIVEELCEGPNLAIWLRDKAAVRQKVPIRAAVQWMLVLAQAVAHAHRCGIVHRDLKPSNVLLGPPVEPTSRRILDDLAMDGQALRVTDFGIAKLFGSEESVTASLAVLGTAAYMAPEQAEGRSREVGPPADVYSLGVILYELLTGRRPIEGRSDVDTLRRVLTDEPQPLTFARPDVPRDLEAICLKCLDKDFTNRYPSAAELADDLRRFLNQEPVCARRLRPAARMIGGLRRRRVSPAAVLISAFFAFTIFAGLVVIILRTRNGDLIVLQSDGPAEQGPVVATRRNYPDDLHRASNLLQGTEVDLAAQSARANEARTILAKYIPQKNGEDVRGFEWHYLWKISHPQTSARILPVRMIAAHNGPVYSVSFSPDGRYVAAASEDKRASVWDVATGQPRFTLLGHTNEVNCIAYSPAGKTLATASEDGTVRLWDATTGAYRNTIWKYTTEICSLAFNPTNSQLACAAHDGRLTVWDCATSQQVAAEMAGSKIDNVAFSADGKQMATASSDGKVRVFEAFGAFNEVASIDVPDPIDVSFSHDGQLLAVGHFYGARVYRIRTKELLTQIRVTGWHVRSVLFTPDDLALLTAGDTPALVDLTTGESSDPFGAPNTLWCVGLSPNNKLAATGDASGKVILWDCSERLGFPRIDLDVPAGSSVARLAISPDGRKLAVATDGAAEKDQPGRGEIAIWDASLSSPKRVLEIDSSGAGRRFRDIAFAPDGNAIAYADSQKERGRLRVVDASNGKSKFQIDTDEIDGLFYTPGGSMLVSQERHGPSEVRLQIRDARTGAPVHTIPLRSNPALFAFSPGENLFASTGGAHDSEVDYYRLPDPKRTASTKGFGETIHALAFSRDGRLLIGRGDGGYVAVLSRQSGAIDRQFTVPGVTSIEGFAMAVSPDGRALALGSKDGVVLADFQTGKALCTLPFPSEVKGVSTVACGSDGRTVAASVTSSQGHCGVYVWQVREGLSGNPEF
jgi:serine/threonine protein kinase/WD40 repeat protein